MKRSALALVLASTLAAFAQGDQATCLQGYVWDPQRQTCEPFSVVQSIVDAAPQAAYTHQAPPTVELPSGVYDLTQPVVITRPVRLVAYGAVLRPAPGVVALHVAADRTIVEGLTVQGPIREDESGTVGVRITSRSVTVRDLFAEDLTRGIDVDGTSNGGNANSTSVDRAHIWRCRVGLRIDGPDSNGGLFQAMDFNANLRAIEDSSFLGNTHIAPTIHPQVQRQTPPAILIDDDTSASVVIGGYLEGAAGFESRSNSVVSIGGNASPQMGPRGDRVGGRQSRAVFNGGTLSTGWQEVGISTARDIPIRWSTRREDGSQVQWMIRRFSGGQWCITTGTRAGCALTWSDPP